MRSKVSQITLDQRDLALSPYDHQAIVKATVAEVLQQLAQRPAPLPAQFVRTEAAARILTIDPDTLEIWRQQRKGPKFRRVGNRVVYAVDDLVAWMKAHPLEEGGARHAAS